jgi:glycosyltransferase involved in cell wall biosynthesis
MAARAALVDDADSCELSVVMPCLNEARTLAVCIRKAFAYFKRADVVGEVVIADNGSDDGSVEVALAHGARVVHVAQRGYGNALRSGMAQARGTFIIMGDSDDSYDFSDLDAFLLRLRAGDDLVMGNRFAGGIAPGAMPWHHRYIGNPVLSFIGRFLFNSDAGDFHCGLRGFRRDSVLALNLVSEGMEYASEMIVKASLSGLKISEVPVTLSKDGRDRPPHLRSFRDGWRHLRLLFLHCPRWLFLYPGLTLLLAGLLAQVLLFDGPQTLGGIGLGIHTMLLGAAASIIGLQVVVYWVISQYVGWLHDVLPTVPRMVLKIAETSLERGLIAGAAIFGVGLLWSAWETSSWIASGFAAREPTLLMRDLIPALSLMVMGVEIVLAALFLSIARLGLRRTALPSSSSQQPACADVKQQA